MDLVVGLSLTSTAVRWVLVEGATGEGAPIDRGAFDVDALDADFLLDILLNHDAVGENHMRAVGVTWTSEGAVAAAAVLDALADRGQRNVVVVADTDAAQALASGIAQITDYDDVAVCIIEPDDALVALVNAGGVTVERIDRPLDREDALELTSSVIAMLAGHDRRPDAIFVVGSDDVEVVVSSFEAISEAPVFSAAEADLALARGAALASAQAVRTAGALGTGMVPRVTSRVGVLSGVLGVAVLTFVVSLSIALGLGLTPESTIGQPQNANAAEKSVPVAVPRPVPRVAASPRAVAPPPPEAPAPEAVPELAETIKVAAPPVYQAPAPAYVPPAPAYVPPAPAYVPPAPANVPPPAYVPPSNPGYVPPTYQEPRLRDRIIERIPIINRFHEPGR